MNLISFFSIWYRPRATMTQLSKQCTKLAHFGFIALFSFLLLAECYFFLWLMDYPLFKNLFQWQGLVLFLATFVLIGASLYTLMTSAALFSWMMAKSLGGEADIFTTRTSLLWSALTLLPLGLLTTLTLYLEKNTSHLFLERGCFIALAGALIYSLICFVKGISEMHQISTWRAMISLLFGAITGTFLVIFLFQMLQPLWH